MLIAKTKENQVVSLHRSFRTADFVRFKKEEWFCVECGERVIFRWGEKTTPHFAHIRLNGCSQPFERETEAHLNGKKQLAAFFEQVTKAEVQLEKYYPSIAQRSDVTMYAQDGKEYVIEFQCSVVPTKRIRERTDCYRKKSISVRWILSSQMIEMVGDGLFSLSSFPLFFLQQAKKNETAYILFYNVKTQQFLYLYDFIQLTKRKWFASIHYGYIPKWKQRLSYPFLWVKEWMKQQRMNRMYLGKTLQKKRWLRNELYFRHIPPSLIPSFIPIPLFKSYYLVESSFIWQLFLYTQWLHGRSNGEILYFFEIEETLQRYNHHPVLKRRSYLGNPDSSIRLSIFEWLHNLTQVGVLEERKEGYLIMKDIELAHSIESAIEENGHYFKQIMDKVD